MSKIKRTDTNAIGARLDSLLGNEKALERLLYLEKERRRVSKDELVFIGMADVAGYYWCAMKSLYKNRQMEPAFFASYLHDRIAYSFRLGLIDELPESHERLLEVGGNIGFSDIERLLKGSAEKTDQRSIILSAIETVDKNGSRVMIVNPDLSQEEVEFFKHRASKGTRIVSLEEAPPTIRGQLLDTTKAEQYPTIRWNYAWDKYVVVGVPDGITSEFVYEFKSTRSRFLMHFLKPVALTQADLYAYFFRRGKKRVQIYVVEEDVTETWDADADVNRAKDVLAKFKKMEEGFVPLPPKAWKCKSCEFAKVCTIRAS
jgi:CRISPR/Cas system-associated exonuclease Cas4 (RecB family)